MVPFFVSVLKNKIFNEYIYECSGEPCYGDVIFCRRFISAYKHFGIYVGNSSVIHFAPKGGDIGGDAVIHRSSLDDFADGNKVYKMKFPEKYKSGSFLRTFVMKDDYHLYSPEETVKRAESKIGMKGIHNEGYNVIMNNCEDFAIWCKTGIAESKQLNSWIDSIIP